MIVIRGEEVDVELKVNPGFWSSDADAEVEIALSIVVTGTEGRLFGTTVSEDGDGEAPLGSFCSGGALALGEATTDAMENVLERMAERLSNASRLRDQVVF